MGCFAAGGAGGGRGCEGGDGREAEAGKFACARCGAQPGSRKKRCLRLSRHAGAISGMKTYWKFIHTVKTFSKPVFSLSGRRKLLSVTTSATQY